MSGPRAVVDADDVALKIYLYSRAQSVMGGTSQIQKNIVATRILGLPTGLTARRADRQGAPVDYDLPDVIRVEADGPVRIVRLSRPEQLNAINDELHLGLTQLFPQLSADTDARVAVITGEGRAFSAGGDFDLLDRMANDRALRRDMIAEGRELVLNMIRCRVPVIAAVNGPAVGLGCSVIALSDVVYMAESAYLSDPHVTVGLVAADGGPLTWPLHTSLLLAKEYAFTGDRITAAARGRDRPRQPRVPRRRGARRRARDRRTRSRRCRSRRSRRRSGC